MKKTIKKIISFVLILTVIAGSGVSAFAADGKPDSVGIEITSNRERYLASGIADISVVVSNAKSHILRDVSVETSFRNMHMVDGDPDNLSGQFESIGAKTMQSFHFKAMVDNTAPKLTILQRIFIFFKGLFHKKVEHVSSSFDDGREYLEQTKTVRFGKAEGEITVRVWYRNMIEVQSLISNIKDVAVGSSETVLFKAKVVSLDKTVTAQKVEIVDENGTDVTVLYDDGKNNDDIAKDGVWSGSATLSSQEGKNVRYYAKVTDNEGSETTSSQFIEICYYTDITAQDFANIDALTDYLTRMKDEMIRAGKKEAQIINEAYAFIERQPFVEKAIKQETSVVFMTDARIHMAFTLEGEGVKSRQSADDTTEGAAAIMPEAQVSAQSGESGSVYDEYPFPNKKSILVLRPYYGIDSNFGTKYTEVATTISSKLGYSVTTVIGRNVTLETMKTFDQYGVVMIDSHGYLNQFSAPATSDICLTQTYSQSIHSADYQSGRIVVSYDKTLFVEPSFFDAYYENGAMENTLVYLGICHGMETRTLSNSLILAGAKSVIGYDDSVSFSRDEAMMQDIFDTMCKESTSDDLLNICVGDACAAARKNHPGTPELVLRGGYQYYNHVLRNEGVSNLGFENGKMKWDGSGDFRILTACGALTPVEGSNMAIIGTGLGSVNDSTSTLSRTFSGVSQYHSLTFDYDVVSEEPSEYVGSKYDDTFTVTVTFVNSAGEQRTVTILKESVNTSHWIYLGGNYFAGGDSSTYHTDWKQCSVNIPSDAVSMKIELRIWDLGDSIYDTATLVDNFVFA